MRHELNNTWLGMCCHLPQPHQQQLVLLLLLLLLLTLPCCCCCHFSTLYSVSVDLRAIYRTKLDRSSAAPCLEHQFERNISHGYLCTYYLHFRSPFTKAKSVIYCELLMMKKCLARQLARSCCSFVCYVPVVPLNMSTQSLWSHNGR